MGSKVLLHIVAPIPQRNPFQYFSSLRFQRSIKQEEYSPYEISGAGSVLKVLQLYPWVLISRVFLVWLSSIIDVFHLFVSSVRFVHPEEISQEKLFESTIHVSRSNWLQSIIVQFQFIFERKHNINEPTLQTFSIWDLLNLKCEIIVWLQVVNGGESRGY